jgi:AraC-like DNA-binding protein
MGFSQSYDGRAQLLQPFHSISKAVQYLRTNYQRRVTLSRLALVSGLSPRQLQRKLKAAFGLGPQQFLIRARLLAGCRMLSETQQGVGEIAYACGFGDQSAFAYHFRRHIGMTPTQYGVRKACLPKPVS